VVVRVVKVELTFFIIVESGSRAVWGGWPAAAVRIQCFGNTCFTRFNAFFILHKYSQNKHDKRKS
jgi:hypothetical protein